VEVLRERPVAVLCVLCVVAAAFFVVAFTTAYAFLHTVAFLAMAVVGVLAWSVVAHPRSVLHSGDLRMLRVMDSDATIKRQMSVLRFHRARACECARLEEARGYGLPARLMGEILLIDRLLGAIGRHYGSPQRGRPGDHDGSDYNAILLQHREDLDA